MKLKKVRYQRIVIPAVAVVIFMGFFLETWPHMPLVNLDTPPVYGEIAASKLPGSVISLPLGWITAGRGSMGQPAPFTELYQTVHLRPMVGGAVNRAPSELIDLMTGAPVLAFLFDPGSPPSERDLDPQEIVFAIDKYKINYIVVHKLYPRQYFDSTLSQVETVITPETLKNIDAYATRNLGMEKFEETDEIVAYRRPA